MFKHNNRFVIHTLLILFVISAVFFLAQCGRIDGEEDDITPVAEFTSDLTVAEELPTETSTTEPLPASSEAETTTEPAPEPLQPTVCPTDEPILPVDLNSLPGNEYVRHMFGTAAEYTGGDGKRYIVEPPPSGRSDELQQKIIPLQLIPAPASYLDDALFIGDSVTTGFESYRRNMDFCGEKIELNYKVFAAKSYGAYNSTLEISDSSNHPLYKGEQCYPEDIIGIYESKKVFLFMGLNDAGWEKSEQFIRYYRSLVTKIRERNPDVKIIIGSITPLTVNGEAGTANDLKNPRIAEFNNLLIELASEENVYFLDYAYCLRDGGHNLYDELSSDDYCHLKSPAYSRILEYILFHPVD